MIKFNKLHKHDGIDFGSFQLHFGKVFGLARIDDTDDQLRFKQRISDPRGKTEAWVIFVAEDDAQLVIGLSF